MKGVRTYGRGMYLWKGCVCMEGVYVVCTYRCVPMEACAPMKEVCISAMGVSLYGSDVYLWKEGMFT